MIRVFIIAHDTRIRKIYSQLAYYLYITIWKSIHHTICVSVFCGRHAFVDTLNCVSVQYETQCICGVGEGT